MATVPIIEYFKPLRAVITIRDKRNDPTYLFHDSFHPPEPSSGSPAIYYCDVDLAYGQAGTFTLKINDHEHQLDDTKIGLGNKVWIQAGRDEDHLFNLFSGVCRSMKPIRQNYNLLGYEMSGFGTQIIMNERVVNYLRTSIRDPANPNKPFVLDPNMTADKLFKVLMTATDIIPIKFPAIKHTLHPGMFNTEDQIDPIVDTFIASLTEPYVEASQVANSIADMAGAIWGVVPQAPGQPDKVFLRFPSLVHSGTIIKDKPDSPEEYTSRNVAYLRAQTGGFSFTDSMRKEDGFTNRIFSKTGADQATGTTSTAAENFTRLSGIDIAQQITINSTRLRDLAFTVGIEGKFEPIGNSSNLWDPGLLNFRIVNDIGNRPGPITELQNNFPLTLENGEVKQLFLKLPQDYQFKTVKPGDKAWVIMFSESPAIWNDDPERCGNDCGCFQENQSAHWHHDGGNTGVSAIRTICVTLPNFTRSPTFNDTSSGWVINTAGPTYSHMFFDSFSHIIEASDQQSIDKYGEVDSFIDFSFLTDENAMNQMLSSVLQYSAKPRRIYEFAEVFIPYEHPIEPGSLVTVIDPVSGHNTNLQTAAEVQEVRYEFAADASGQTPLGTNTCEVRLLGYVDFRERHVLAISEQSIQGPIPAPTPGDPPPPPPPPPPPATELDTDGVKIIYPLNNTQGKFHNNLVDEIGTSASSFGGNDTLEMDIEGNATKTTSGGVTYWRCISREGSFASGGTNWTSRPEWVANGCNTPAGVSGAKSRGYLCNANDPKSLEATIIFKVTGIHDNSEEATMGVRGDDHSDGNEKTLQMKNFFPYGQHTTDQWGFEKTHPDAQRRAVTFVSPYNSSNHPLVGSNTWRGMKLAVWNVNNNQGVHCEMWIDESPINPSGGYNNNWKKVWIFEQQASDTPTWGGPRQQFRVDMCDELHLAAFSCHEIIPPGNATSADYSETDAKSQTATAETLAEKAEYEETTGLTHPDYIAEMVDIGTEPDINNELGAEQAGLRPTSEIEAITSTETGGTLRPKTIARESHPIIAERDEIDATFGA